MVKKTVTICFHLIPERNGRTDRFAISISRVSMLTRDKNIATLGFSATASSFFYNIHIEQVEVFMFLKE